MRATSLHQVFASSEIADEHPDVDVDRWRALAVAALDSEHAGAGELNLIFIDEVAMADLNAEHMGVPGPTDVLAFPIDGASAADADVPVLLGDVVVCPSVADRNAGEAGTPVDDELALLVIHGVLHVLGHDHQEAEEAQVMKSREQALLEAHHRR